MKRIALLSLLSIFCLTQTAKADIDDFEGLASITAVPVTIVVAPLISVSCGVAPGSVAEDVCQVMQYVSLLEVTTAAVLLKEAQEVKSDAINFIAGEEATPALESVVERFQEAALEQGKEVSFDEIIEVLIQL